MTDDPLDNLLREAVEQLTPIPATLTPNVERRLQVAVWRPRVIAATALAASIAGIWLTSHIALTPPTPVIAKVDPPAKKPDVRITFARESNVIAVPIESDNPNVTVVMVYQAVRPTPRNRSEQ